MIEFATSITSARVGNALVIIDCIICVAVIVKQSLLRAALMICFCKIGNSSSPISTPKSPRAIITPSEASIISSRLSKASARSILETIAPFPPAAKNNFRASSTSAALRTKEIAKKSAFSLPATTISALSFSVSAPADKPPPRKFKPLLFDNLPPTKVVQ